MYMERNFNRVNADGFLSARAQVQLVQVQFQEWVVVLVVLVVVMAVGSLPAVAALPIIHVLRLATSVEDQTTLLAIAKLRP
jgi:hypothetical protein